MSTYTRNRARCKKCQDIIESKFRHDFQTCSCGAISVDGGKDYKRWVGPFELIEIVPDDYEEKK